VRKSAATSEADMGWFAAPAAADIKSQLNRGSVVW
jgi:hypothetical protein